MGALTSNRKPGEECFTLNHGYPPLHLRDLFSKIDLPVAKKRRYSVESQSLDVSLSSKTAASRLGRYPSHVQQFKREVHAPCRGRRDGFSSGMSRESMARAGGTRETKGSADYMGNVLQRNYDRAKSRALSSLRHFWKEKEVIKLDEEPEKGEVLDDSSKQELGVEEYRREVEACTAHLNERSQVNHEIMLYGQKPEVEILEGQFQPSSSAVTDLTNDNLRVDDAEKMLDSLSLDLEGYAPSTPLYEKLYKSAEKRNQKLSDLGFQIELTENRRSSFSSFRPKKKPEEDDRAQEAFVPLTEDEEDEISCAFRANWKKVLVTHENSSIEITGEVFQCLRPGAWLNDEVINVYLELLKERENREPQKFLKCHFFNTFFYKKLIGGRSGYEYKSVRRWTTQRKLGYSLIECDKIFVPIHKEIHWCLAVINKKDEKLQYLDSLRGSDTRVLKVLARYIADEVKDKNGEDIDVSAWEQEIVEGLPAQENGSDCGMFMLKYADFYSRGLGLCFKQENMPYFRRRTAKEILRLRAD